MDAKDNRKEWALRLATAQIPMPAPEQLREDMLQGLVDGPFAGSLEEQGLELAKEFLTLDKINAVFDKVREFAAELFMMELTEETICAATQFYESDAGREIVALRAKRAGAFRRYNDIALSELFNSVVEHLIGNEPPQLVLPDGDTDTKLILP
jgi:hypothetical protein